MITAKEARENVKSHQEAKQAESHLAAIHWIETVANPCINTASNAGKYSALVGGLQGMGQVATDMAIDILKKEYGYTAQLRMPDILIGWGE